MNSQTQRTISVEKLLAPFIENGARVFAVTGSGGKTTLIRKVALAFGKKMNVAVAASTKMYLPDNKWVCQGKYPEIVIGDGANCCQSFHSPGITFIGNQLSGNGKISGIDDTLINRFWHQFDIFLIEADGSKEKPLKGWAEHEPVIPKRTDLTIGIIPMHCLNQVIDEKIIHRMEIFCEIIHKNKGDKITIEDYEKLILHKNGLFKNAVGYKVLVLNRVGKEEEQMISYLVEKCSTEVDLIIYGCLDEET